jgi:hypothetical protein
MVLLLRYAAPRISDVVTLTEEHIKGNYLQKRAIKNGRMIRVELPPETCCHIQKQRRERVRLFLRVENPAYGASSKGPSVPWPPCSGWRKSNTRIRTGFATRWQANF